MKRLSLFALLLAALACNAPLDAPTPAATAEIATVEGSGEETAATATPETAAEATAAPTNAPAQATSVPSGGATPTSDYEAGGLTRTDGPVDDPIFLDFREDLANAISINRDYDAMQEIIRPEFIVVVYGTEAQPPTFADTDEAIEYIEDNVVKRTAFITFSFGINTTNYISDDPMTYFESEDPIVAAFSFEGLGPDGEDDGLVIVAYDLETSEYYWYGVILVPAGFNK